ncbi:ABC transporter ATP-binding protein [Salinicoccus jeotgali]|uniref:ABC transporter ATP-binding protein n=1 Tax=Salinicoccus jeotgali TaxID=381634 RepID=A0ABP7EHU2_9STAP
MLTVYKFALKYKWFMAIALFFMLIELTVELTQPYLISKVIDDGIVAESIDTVWFYLIVMFAISMVAFISGIMNSLFASHVANSFSYDLRTALFRRVQYFTLATLSKFPTSSLITRMTQDVLQSEMLLYMSLRVIIKAPLLVVGSLIMSFVVNPTLGFYLSFLTPLLLIFLIFTARKGGQIFLRVQKRLDKINRFIQQNLEAVRLIKANDRADFEISKFSKVAGRLRDDTIYALRLMESIMPVLLLIINGSLLVVLWMASDLLQNNTIQVGEVVAVVNYALRMQGGFSMFAFIIIAFSRSKASSDRMEEVLKSPISINDNAEIVKENQAGSVKFEGVSFKYPGSSRYVLRDISFEVREKEKFIIMGGTGSGKSTLLSLIPKMYETEEGNIYINGRDIKEWNEEDLRQAIGYVPQSAVLFSGSIFENLLWGDLEALESDIFTSTQKAQIHNSIESFDHRYDTRVGQRGVTLSGGQKQRLSIARALVRKPGILILDDSTSALDIRTESALWEAIREEETTQIIVTQKIVTAKMADRILLLEGGKINALGSHEELLQQSDLYRSIVESQTEGGQLDD